MKQGVEVGLAHVVLRHAKGMEQLYVGELLLYDSQPLFAPTTISLRGSYKPINATTASFEAMGILPALAQFLRSPHLLSGRALPAARAAAASIAAYQAAPPLQRPRAADVALEMLRDMAAEQRCVYVVTGTLTRELPPVGEAPQRGSDLALAAAVAALGDGCPAQMALAATTAAVQQHHERGARMAAGHAALAAVDFATWAALSAQAGDLSRHARATVSGLLGGDCFFGLRLVGAALELADGRGVTAALFRACSLAWGLRAILFFLVLGRVVDSPGPAAGGRWVPPPRVSFCLAFCGLGVAVGPSLLPSWVVAAAAAVSSAAFVPQIVASAAAGSRYPMPPAAVVVLAATRVAAIALPTPSVRLPPTDSLPAAGAAAAAVLAVQAALAWAQWRGGGAAILPRRLRPERFDYHAPFAADPARHPQWDEEARGVACAICHAAVGAEDAAARARMVTPCGHAYHTMCLARWMALAAHCPLCRAPLPPP